MSIAKREGVFEDTASNHNALYPVLFCECLTVGTVFYVAVDSKERLRRNFITEFFNFGNKFVVRIYFAHFFTCTKVDSKVNDILFKDVGEPVAPFVYFYIA